MEKSELQLARAAYLPKLPKGLQGNVKVKEGAPTQSVDNQEEIKKLFPNTYGMPLVEFVPGDEAHDTKMNVGVILSQSTQNKSCRLYRNQKKSQSDRSSSHRR